MEFPSVPDESNVTAIQYVVHVSGEQGGDASFILGNVDANSIGVDDATLIALFEGFISAVQAEAEANKPIGSSVTVTGEYVGTASHPRSL